MAETGQEKEFNVFGFNTAAMRRGIIIFFFAVFMGAIIALYRQNQGQQKKIDDQALKSLNMQAELYEKMIEEVRKQVSPAVDKVNEAAIKVDNAATTVDSIAQKSIKTQNRRK